jgi:hypothetical protein
MRLVVVKAYTNDFASGILFRAIPPLEVYRRQLVA